MGLLAETPLHPGTETATDVIDLPVARETTTQYPVIVGSALKGALRARAQQEQEWRDSNRVQTMFGRPDSSGTLIVSDARLLLLPVRSLSGPFKWVTSPYALERFRRDLNRIGHKTQIPDCQPAKGEVLTKESGRLFLEEFSFTSTADEKVVKQIVTAIQPLVYHKSVQERLLQQVVICNDSDFAYFARYSLQVNARNQLNDESKTSENLWYEETIPPDSLFYSIIVEQANSSDTGNHVQTLFEKAPYLQVGGNETIGQGWCAVSWINCEDGDSH